VPKKTTSRKQSLLHGGSSSRQKKYAIDRHSLPRGFEFRVYEHGSEVLGIGGKLGTIPM